MAMQPSDSSATNSSKTSRTWMCANCGYIYDQAKGDPDGGIAPGTAWEDVPDDWRCPDCAAGKEDFEMVEL